MSRAPAFVFLVAMISGIIVDRFVQVSFFVWLITASCALGIARYSGVRSRRSAPLSSSRLSNAELLFLLIGLVCLGGAYHHYRYSIRNGDDISRFARVEPEPIRLRGSLVSEPLIIPSNSDPRAVPFPQSDRSVFELQCTNILNPNGDTSVSGRVRVSFDGHLADVHAGDQVLLYGTLSLPREPANPMEFDFREWLRRRGIFATLDVEGPDFLVREKRWTWFNFARWRRQWQVSAERGLRNRLEEPAASVAVALLLGPRQTIPEDLYSAFVETGSLHLLAISGLNIGILALLAWAVARFFRLSHRFVLLAVILTIGWYLFLTDGQPPVWRASLAVWIWLGAEGVRRRMHPVQHLSLTGLFVLWENPTHLFDISAQLSFLAVCGLVWWGSLPRPIPDLLSSQPAPIYATLFHWVLRKVVSGYGVTSAIWLFTAPWTISVFQLISPIGFLMNLILIPWSTAMIGLGSLQLLMHFLFPFAADLVSAPFSWLLQGFLQLIDLGAQVPLASLPLPAFPGWWMFGYYLILILAILATASHNSPGQTRSDRPSRSYLQKIRTPIYWRVFGIWAVLGGLLVSLPAQDQKVFRFTALSVGHGAALIIETPEKKVLIFDCGSLFHSERAPAAIAQYLNYRRHRSVDLLILSHADIDHYNGASSLLRRMDVGKILIGRGFLDPKQELVMETCEEAFSRGVPIEIVSSADRIILGSAELEFLHPPAEWDGTSDNAGSLALLIRHAGKSILLTGDLEGLGLDRLLSLPAPEVDLLVAPHHGSLRSNPEELNEWATPEIVLVSGRNTNSFERLEQIYPDSKLFHTALHGAISIRIDQTGEMLLSTFGEKGD